MFGFVLGYFWPFSGVAVGAVAITVDHYFASGGKPVMTGEVLSQK